MIFPGTQAVLRETLIPCLIQKGFCPLVKISETKTAIEAQMILNHKDAIEFLVDGSDEIGFNRYSIHNLHGLLSNNFLPIKPNGIVEGC